MKINICIDDIEEFISIIRKAIIEDKMTDDEIIKCVYRTILKSEVEE